MFEQAEGGTILLDEIGELELGLQAKLLRVLDEGTFRRVGGLKDLPLDVRMIAASNRDLKAESDNGRFRLDLYYRLSVIQIDLPALRERGDDVMVLAKCFIEHFNEQLRRRVSGLTPKVAELLRHYRWPGNVRELRNVIERVMILEDGDLITTAYPPRSLMLEDMPATGAVSSPHPDSEARRESGAEYLAEHFQLPAEGVLLEELEMSPARQSMERSGGNQMRAAELLGISRDQLRYRLKKLESAVALG